MALYLNGVLQTGNAETLDGFGPDNFIKNENDSIAITNIPNDLLTTAKMATEQKRGAALGVAGLDAAGQVPLDQLGNIPASGVTKEYVDSIIDSIALGGIF